jgi:hypothetical protein
VVKLIAPIQTKAHPRFEQPVAGAKCEPSQDRRPHTAHASCLAGSASPNDHAANREQLIKRRLRDSELVRQRIGEPSLAEIEQLDTCRTGRAGAPALIFVCGASRWCIWRLSVEL